MRLVTVMGAIAIFEPDVVFATKTIVPKTWPRSIRPATVTPAAISTECRAKATMFERLSIRPKTADVFNCPRRILNPPLLRGLHLRRIEETAGLPAPQRRIMAVLPQQRVVGALLDDAAAVEHDQAVHPRDGREPVRDRDHGFAGHQGAEALLDRGFHFAVERG